MTYFINSFEQKKTCSDVSIDMIHVYSFSNYKINGVWLSLVERCVWDAEVAGSIPVTPI